MKLNTAIKIETHEPINLNKLSQIIIDKIFPSDGTLSDLQEQLIRQMLKQLSNENKQTNFAPSFEKKARQVFNPYRNIGKEKFMTLIRTKTAFKGSILTLIEQLAFHSKLHGFSWARNKTLAKKTGLHRNTISRHKKTLIKGGFIEKCEIKLGGIIRKGQRFLWHNDFGNYEDYIKNLEQPAQEKIHNYELYKNVSKVHGMVHNGKKMVHGRLHYETTQHAENININMAKNSKKSNRTYNKVLNNNKTTTTNTNQNKHKFKVNAFKNQNQSSSFSFEINSLKTLSKNDEVINYWIDKGLTDWHINNWTKEITHNIEETEKCLTYAYHDLTAGKKKVHNPIGYLFRIMERTGTYANPQNYKTEKEIKIEKQKQLETEKIAYRLL